MGYKLDYVWGGAFMAGGTFGFVQLCHVSFSECFAEAHGNPMGGAMYIRSSHDSSDGNLWVFLDDVTIDSCWALSTTVFTVASGAIEIQGANVNITRGNISSCWVTGIGSARY